MQQYRPPPTPPGQPNDCLGCGTEIDGDAVEGVWVERDHWQAPTTYELHCLSCVSSK
ncbi:hypothetical protein [Haloterrigena sp. H1]|uniref:hypothetical protein n=1 Tax=Haloterrigena sp. H1 TaxID=2552943 RepID=UPI0014870E4C|nr:hypothetical protein [Haloterrigena sp. H1]